VALAHSIAQPKLAPLAPPSLCAGPQGSGLAGEQIWPSGAKSVALVALSIYREVMATMMTAHTLDPADAGVRSDASRLAEGVDDSTTVGRFVRSMLDHVAAGELVVMLRAEDEVTPAEAARILGVTRQYVDRLCEDEVLPFRRLPGSSHRRLRVADVLAASDERRRLREGHEALLAAMTDAGLAND
jgi:excisionase family DNA binding protein